MKRVVIGLALSLTLATPPAYANHRRDERPRCDDSRDCDRNYGGGNGNSGKEGDQDGKDNCHSFCNNVIIIPNPVPGGQQPGKPSSITCLVPVPYHCDPRPGGEDET